MYLNPITLLFSWRQSMLFHHGFEPCIGSRHRNCSRIRRLVTFTLNRTFLDLGGQCRDVDFKHLDLFVHLFVMSFEGVEVTGDGPDELVFILLGRRLWFRLAGLDGKIFFEHIKALFQNREPLEVKPGVGVVVNLLLDSNRFVDPSNENAHNLHLFVADPGDVSGRLGCALVNE